MQTIDRPALFTSPPRLLLKNGSADKVPPPNVYSARLSPKMSPSTASSLKRHVGTRWLWQRQSKISRKRIAAGGQGSR